VRGPTEIDPLDGLGILPIIPAEESTNDTASNTISSVGVIKWLTGLHQNWWTYFVPRVRSSFRSRRVDGHAITAIAPLVALFPVWALAVAVFWAVASIFFNTSYFVFAGIWLAAGIILFLQPTQKLVLRRLLGARKPFVDEKEKLDRAWNVVAQANHLRPSQFVLAVIDAEDVNAFASGGHLVVVSSYAVDNLTHEQLTGVLAHELSHHLGYHTVALTIAQWLSVPIVVLARIGFRLQNIARAASSSFAPQSQIVQRVEQVFVALLTVVSWVFLAALTLAQTVGNIVGKGTEFKADERAIQMGFGKELSSALRHVIDDGVDDRPTNWRDRLISAHPPARTRVARIDANLRQRKSQNRP
jgi:Zn-dependent protease with chaperone function